MSRSRLIATTRSAGLRPVSTPGQRDYGLVTQALRQRLGGEHARLFAEPVPNPDGRSVDWYVEADGPVRGLDDLPPEAREEVEQRLSALIDDIRTDADRLATSRDPEAQGQAALLRAAIEIPDLSYVRVVGDAPVLIAWAHRYDRPDAPAGVLGSWVAARPRPAPEPPPSGAVLASVPALVVARDRRSWATLLLWLLFLMLVAAIAWLLLRACGVLSPWAAVLPLPQDWLDRCPVMAAAADPLLDGTVERRRALESEIAELERRLAERQMLCRVETARQESVPPQEACPPQDEIDRRLVREGARGGAVQVSLSWDGLTDLDLSVVCPTGAKVWYGEPEACGGQLDVDMNNQAYSREPVEHIVWADGTAPEGEYRVFVRWYRGGDGPRVDLPFKVRARFNGQTKTASGTITVGARQPQDPVLVFEVTNEPPPAQTAPQTERQGPC